MKIPQVAPQRPVTHAPCVPNRAPATLQLAPICGVGNTPRSQAPWTRIQSAFSSVGKRVRNALVCASQSSVAVSPIDAGARKQTKAFSSFQTATGVDKAVARAHLEDLLQRVRHYKATDITEKTDDVRRQKLACIDIMLPTPTAERSRILELHKQNHLSEQLNPFLRTGKVVPSGGRHGAAHRAATLHTQARAFDDLLRERTSPIPVSTFHAAVYDAEGVFGSKIQVGEMVSDPGYFFTSIDTSSDPGFLETIGDDSEVYFRIDGRGAVMPRDCKYGEVIYRPNTPMLVKAIAQGPLGSGTFVWLEQIKSVAPKGSSIFNTSNGLPHRVIHAPGVPPFAALQVFRH